MVWKRSENISHGRVWKTFDGLREVDGVLPKFWIQNVKNDQIDSIVNLIVKGLYNEEPVCLYSNFSDDAVSSMELIPHFKHLLEKGLSVVCMTTDANGNPIIAGFSCLERLSQDDIEEHDSYLGEQNLNQEVLFNYLYSVKDLYGHFGMHEYLRDRGIYVLPNFRGQGICVELLQCWPLICKETGLKIAMGAFTSIYSQKAAKRAGLKVFNSFPYEKLRQELPEYVPDDIEEHTETVKLMYTAI